jgi:hypothetical protein
MVQTYLNGLVFLIRRWMHALTVIGDKSFKGYDREGFSSPFLRGKAFDFETREMQALEN